MTGGAPAAVVKRKLGDIDGFDGMRGIALIIVLVAHLEVVLPIPTLLVVPGGTVSLDSFFVLSGFLITALLLREQSSTGTVKRWHFYRRRIFRLLPALLVVLVANAAFSAAVGVWPRTEWPSLLSIGGYFSNYYVAASPNDFCANLAPGLQHLWSLSFEEQFYVVWPWVTIFALSITRRLRTVVMVILSMIALVGVRRGLEYHSVASWCSLFHQTDTRADSILWGALLAHVWVRHREPTRGVRIAATVAAAFLIVCLPLANLTGPFLYRGGFDLIDLSCAILLLAILQGNWRARRIFEFRPLVRLGVMSYGIYLWHMPVYYAIAHFDHRWSQPVRVVVAMGGAVLMGTLSWYYVESPMLRLRERLDRRDARREERRRESPVGTPELLPAPPPL